MNNSNYIGIIADDLTGANDTSLQFFLKGCKTQVAFGEDFSPDENLQTEVFAVSTETRNTDAETARERCLKVAENIIKKYNFEHVYKKIDSVLRGNIAVEIMSILESLEYDAAVICPAFPNEGRTTIGGFHLVKGIPLQRTEVSRDPFCPVTESNILSILRNKLPKELSDSVALVSLDVVMKGAGPVYSKINEFVSEGKKFLVVDAVSVTDVEQTALAITKSNYKLLPCGSAGLGQALSSVWHPDNSEGEENISSPALPVLPKLVISGSATELTASQIKRLQESDYIENTYFIPIKPENIFLNDYEETAKRALNNLVKENTVIIHSSDLTADADELNSFLIEHELSKEVFISKICDYLSAVTRVICAQKEVVLVTVGGETSYKCLRATGIQNLMIADTVAQAIPLGTDAKGRYIVTKSGNLGNQNTLIEILKYFEQER